MLQHSAIDDDWPSTQVNFLMNVGLVAPYNVGAQQTQVVWPSNVAQPSTVVLQLLSHVTLCCANGPAAGNDKQCIRQAKCDLAEQQSKLARAEGAATLMQISLDLMQKVSHSDLHECCRSLSLSHLGLLLSKLVSQPQHLLLQLPQLLASALKPTCSRVRRCHVQYVQLDGCLGHQG